MWVVLVIALAAAVGGGYVYWRKRQSPAGTPMYYCRCPHCQRKMHYHPERANHKARCPGCKKPFTYPAMPESA